MNYTEGNLEGCRDMLLHPSMVPGLADTGAHVGSMQDAMNATYLLTYVSASTPGLHGFVDQHDRCRDPDGRPSLCAVGARP